MQYKRLALELKSSISNEMQNFGEKTKVLHISRTTHLPTVSSIYGDVK